MSTPSITTQRRNVAPTTDSRFMFDVLRRDGPVLVDFHAPWCRTCQILEPVLDELAARWADGVRVVSVDIERHPGAARRHHVQSIPTLVLFDHGAEQDRLINVIRRERIDDWLHDRLDGPPAEVAARQMPVPSLHETVRPAAVTVGGGST